jgi:hypothetical protein
MDVKLILTRAGIFFFAMSSPALGSVMPHIQRILMNLSPDAKQLKQKADYSPP